jgi:hypothetical protein
MSIPHTRFLLLRAIWAKLIGNPIASDTFFYRSRWGLRSIRRKPHLSELNESAVLSLLHNKYLSSFDREILVSATYTLRDEVNWARSPLVLSAITNFPNISLHSLKCIASYAPPNTLAEIAKRKNIDQELFEVLINKDNPKLAETLASNKYLSLNMRAHAGLLSI